MRLRHPKADAGSLKDLADARWIRTLVAVDKSAELANVFEQYGLEPPQVEMTAASTMAIILTVAHSDLLTMLPKQWLAFVATRELLQPIYVAEPLPAPPVCMVSRARLPLTPAAEFLADPPLFACERIPMHGHSILQAGGPIFKMFNDYLGDQWRVGDWRGFSTALVKFAPQIAATRSPLTRPEPPLNIQEYDPEWGRAFYQGTVSQSCPHDKMLAQVKTPILLTHHIRMIDPVKGNLIGAISDFQAEQVKRIVEGAGVRYDYASLPDAMHQLHITDSARYVKILTDWAKTLP